jgi:hypothetical protein
VYFILYVVPTCGDPLNKLSADTSPTKRILLAKWMCSCERATTLIKVETGFWMNPLTFIHKIVVVAWWIVVVYICGLNDRGGQKLPNRSEFDEIEKEFDCWVVVSWVTGWSDEKNWILMDRNGWAQIDFLDPMKSETDRTKLIFPLLLLLFSLPTCIFSLIRDNHTIIYIYTLKIWITTPFYFHIKTCMNYEWFMHLSFFKKLGLVCSNK